MGQTIFLARRLLLGEMVGLGTHVFADETLMPRHMEGIDTRVNMNNPDAAVTDELLPDKMEPAVNASGVN